MLRLPDRSEAGRYLAGSLGRYRGRTDVLVLAIPPGGVLVGAALAAELGVALDVFVARELHLPDQPHHPVGVIGSGSVRVIDERALRSLGGSEADVERMIAAETPRLRQQEDAYRRGREPLSLRGRTVILTSDGWAEGDESEVTVEAVRRLGPWRVVVAAPVAADRAWTALRRRADECVFLATPRPFHAVRHWYDDFHDVTDREVIAALPRPHAQRCA